MEYLYVAGWKEVSLVDVLHSVSFTVWLSGCNYRCPWCSNALVARGVYGRRVAVRELAERVREAAPFLDYLHITGGEPTLQYKGLLALFRAVEGLGLKYSLDTNASLPEFLSHLVPMLHHVAVDLKAPLSDVRKYAEVTGLPVELAEKYVKAVWRSLELLREVPFLELRVTLVPELIGEKEVLAIAREIKSYVAELPSPPVFVVQQFIPYEGVVDDRFKNRPRTPPEIVRRIAVKVAELLPAEVYYRTLEEGAVRVKAP